MLSEAKKKYMRLRRLKLKRRGICVDCQRQPIKPGLNMSGKPHSCCEGCLQARRDRSKADRLPPIFREIQKAERQQDGDGQ